MNEDACIKSEAWDIKANVRLLALDHAEDYTGRIVDIAPTWAIIKVTGPFQNADMLKVQFVLPVSRRKVDAYAEVVWVTPEDARVGVKFRIIALEDAGAIADEASKR